MICIKSNAPERKHYQVGDIEIWIGAFEEVDDVSFLTQEAFDSLYDGDQNFKDDIDTGLISLV